MTSRPQTNDERINLRLQHSAKLKLERAASLEGQTVSKFVLNCALSQAEKKIQEHDVMALNATDSHAFFDALAAPVKFNKKLMTALQEHEQRIVDK